MRPWFVSACSIAFVMYALILSGCSNLTAISHYNKSTDNFHPLNTEHRVLYEPGAEQFASTVAKALPHSIEKVQNELFGRYSKGIRIYVCESPESFKNMTGREVKAITYRQSVFLSPRLMQNPEDVPLYLTHELTHLFMLQHLGLYKYTATPAWFNEGLAVYVSKGGGAGTVTEREAADSILSGKSFVPNNGGGLFDLLFPKYGDHWNLKPHMFYRQASLFVSFMKEGNDSAFENMLAAMQRGQSLDIAFRQAYNTSILEMWQLFLKHLKSEPEYERAANEKA